MKDLKLRKLKIYIAKNCIIEAYDIDPDSPVQTLTVGNYDRRMVILRKTTQQFAALLRKNI